MIVEFKEGERKRTIHKMDITYEKFLCFLNVKTINLNKQN